MAVAFRTEWSTPGTIQMPRIGYEQEQLVSASLGASAPLSTRYQSDRPTTLLPETCCHRFKNLPSAAQGERRANPLYRADLLPQEPHGIDCHTACGVAMSTYEPGLVQGIRKAGFESPLQNFILIILDFIWFWDLGALQYTTMHF